MAAAALSVSTVFPSIAGGGGGAAATVVVVAAVACLLW